MGNGVEAPAQFSRAHVIGANIARKGGQGLRLTATDNEEVFVNDRRAGQRNGTSGHIAPQTLAQINTAAVAEGWDRLPGICVQFVNEIHHA